MYTLRYALITAMTLGFSLPAQAQMSDACYADCNALQTELDALVDELNQSAATSGGKADAIDALKAAIKACETRCGALESLQNEYRDCIKRVEEAQANPNLDLTPEEIAAEIENCRTDYRHGKDDFHKDY